MEKTTLYLPKQLQRELKDAARRTGRPQAELIREALTKYLAKQERPLPGFVGIIDDPDMIPASEAKRWLREKRIREWEDRKGSNQEQT